MKIENEECGFRIFKSYPAVSISCSGGVAGTLKRGRALLSNSNSKSGTDLRGILNSGSALA